jgi:hypothetical protein
MRQDEPTGRWTSVAGAFSGCPRSVEEAGVVASSPQRTARTRSGRDGGFVVEQPPPEPLVSVLLLKKRAFQDM